MLGNENYLNRDESFDEEILLVEVIDGVGCKIY